MNKKCMSKRRQSGQDGKLGPAECLNDAVKECKHKFFTCPKHSHGCE